MGERLNQVLQLAALVVLCAAACGDDGGDDRGARGDAGISGAEGSACRAPNECAADLMCVASPIAVNGIRLGVCGRPCDGPDDCDGRCVSYSGEAGDGHCADVIDAEFARCGVADTSICAEHMSCLYLPGQVVGHCVRLCALDGGGGGGAGGDEDAGVDLGDEDAGVETGGGCGEEQTCLDGVLANPEPNEGVCGETAERGALCGLDMGRFCEPGDVCAFEDPSDPESVRRCVAR